MAVEFLIGPAGSGKTHGCLAQVRQALSTSPDGLPLLWIAPKQATFQLERQILALDVRGFTRLQVLPFDRLARWILAEVRAPVCDMLSEEGRMMVLRALLLRHETDLRAFRTSARSSGFPAQLSQVLRELHRTGAGSEQLRQVQLPGHSGAALADKLHDLSLLLRAYRDWLDNNHLRDADDSLGMAAAALTQARKTGSTPPRFAALWLDGFAEMTVPELDLLAAVLPGCEMATLGFCLDNIPCPTAGTRPPSTSATPQDHSLWGVTASTYLRCLDRVQALGLTTSVRLLSGPDSEAPMPPRFRASPAIAHLAAAWSQPEAATSPAGCGVAGPGCGVNLVECADPEAEALLAVRLIQRHVRGRHARYRDISVIVRRMDGYGHLLQRAFRRHGIPFFADHREPMGHHPVAELTRSALRMPTFNWVHEEWLGALKSGLVSDNPVLVDNLENAALRHGLRGDDWLRIADYQVTARLSPDVVRCLEKPLAAFGAFRDVVRHSSPVNGRVLADALRALWDRLGIAETLSRWQAAADDLPPLFRAIHHTAWEQIHAWCDSFAVAFADIALPMRDWLAIAESGLSRLTLGVIPSSLDQVLIGAIDRARQPEVTLTLVLGLNEGEFPAPPAAPALLNRAERQALAEGGLDLGWGPLQQAAREAYYAYIACTRSGGELCVTWSRRGFDGKSRARSSAAERVLTLMGWKANQPAESGDATAFDGRLKAFSGNPRPDEAGSLSELLECPGWPRSLPASLPADNPARTAARRIDVLLEQLRPDHGEAERRLARPAIDLLHPLGELVSSVSALENFAECPFRHFAKHQLHLGERKEFEADAAGAGTLLHAILKRFHDETIAHGRRWRDWTDADAARRVRELGAEILAGPDHGALRQNAIARWETIQDIDQLAVAAAQMVSWSSTCRFDPFLAELTFGDDPGARVPAWTLDLGVGRTLRIRGSVDRIDAVPLPGGGLGLAVFDYKSTAKSPNRAQLEQGMELQLLAYLAFATISPEVAALVCPESDPRIAARPAGGFYVPLAPKLGAVARTDDAEQPRRRHLESLTHLGRGDRELLEIFDSSPGCGARGWQHSRQFKPSHFVVSQDFEALLSGVVKWLKQHGRQILEGTIGVLPARYGAGRTACDYCDYRAFCRFDRLQGEFRPVTAKSPVDAPAPATETA